MMVWRGINNGEQRFSLIVNNLHTKLLLLLINLKKNITQLNDDENRNGCKEIVITMIMVGLKNRMTEFIQFNSYSIFKSKNKKRESE